MTNLIHNLSNADYHAHPAVSSSQLKHMLRTPKTLFGSHQSPKISHRQYAPRLTGAYATA